VKALPEPGIASRGKPLIWARSTWLEALQQGSADLSSPAARCVSSSATRSGSSWRRWVACLRCLASRASSSLPAIGSCRTGRGLLPRWSGTVLPARSNAGPPCGPGTCLGEELLGGAVSLVSRPLPLRWARRASHRLPAWSERAAYSRAEGRLLRLGQAGQGVPAFRMLAQAVVIAASPSASPPPPAPQAGRGAPHAGRRAPPRRRSPRIGLAIGPVASRNRVRRPA